MPEVYFNNFQTTVAPGGYTSGSGILNVLSTSGISLSAGETTRLSIFTGSPELVVILIATAVNSGTQFAVTAETADVSASGGDLVLNTLSVGAMTQIRADINGVGTYANLPTLALTSGMRYKTTDAPYEFVYGASWEAFIAGVAAVIPPNVFSWVNQGSAAVSQTSGYVALTDVAGGGGVQMRIRTVTQPSTPYILDAIFSVPFMPFAGTGNCNFGVGFRDSGSGKLETLHFSMSATVVNGWQINQWTNPTTFSNNPFTTVGGTTPVLSPLFVRISNDGSNLKYFVGDGISWFQIYTEAVGSFLTPTDICFFIDLEGSVNGQMNLLSWFTH